MLKGALQPLQVRDSKRAQHSAGGELGWCQDRARTCLGWVRKGRDLEGSLGGLGQSLAGRYRERGGEGEWKARSRGGGGGRLC